RPRPGLQRGLQRPGLPRPANDRPGQPRGLALPQLAGPAPRPLARRVTTVSGAAVVLAVPRPAAADRRPDGRPDGRALQRLSGPGRPRPRGLRDRGTPAPGRPARGPPPGAPRTARQDRPAIRPTSGGVRP